MTQERSGDYFVQLSFDNGLEFGFRLARESYPNYCTHFWRVWCWQWNPKSHTW